MGETCEVCGLELASIETRNLLHAGELVRYGEYRGKCVRDASCLQRSYEREKARADAADVALLDAKLDHATYVDAYVVPTAESLVAAEAALAAARRECEELRVHLRKMVDLADYHVNEIECIAENDFTPENITRLARRAAPSGRRRRR